MNINFDAETEQGNITFKGELTKEEVDFLLRFAILSLMARGTLPIKITDEEMDESPVSIN